MIIKGKLITCKREVKEFNGKSGKEKLYITLADADISEEKWDEIRGAFEESGKKFTPDWVKNFNGYVNVSTEYKMPCKDPDLNQYDSVEDFIKDFAWLGAPCKLSLSVKDGAIYPNAIVFTGEGKKFDPFAEFDNDDED